MSYQPSEQSAEGQPNPDTNGTRSGLRASTYRAGLLAGAGLALVGIFLSLAVETVVSPMLLIAGWLVIAWSTHRMGRSGPLFNWPSPQSRGDR